MYSINDPFYRSLSGHGSCQHALCAPHGGLWGLLHRSAHPAANLRCLLEVHVHAQTRTWCRRAWLTLTHPLCRQHSGDFYLYAGSYQYMKCILCVSSVVPRLQWGLIRNKWFNYSRGWRLDFGNTHDRWQNQANDSAMSKKRLLSPSNCHEYLSHMAVTLSRPLLCRYIRSERSIILVNFCLSILASNLLILVGQSQTLSKVRCC